MSCPRCGTGIEFEINLYFGKRDLISYRLGDTYQWVPRKAAQNGGRPRGGNLDGDGYTECPKCEDGFNVVVEIRNDIVTSVRF
jgi:hypothetical protein